MMDWLPASGYWLARFMFERSLATVFLIAFASTLHQFPALAGENGLLPAPEFLRVVPLRFAPSIFHWRYSDRLLGACCWTGMVISAALIAGVPENGPAWGLMLAWFVVWALYLSILHAGQAFYGFVWETLLLEAGFTTIFLGPDWMAPPITTIVLIRWLLFRLEVGAGLIKIRHDPAWRDLTALFYHHETQPMPNPLSWYFHRLPKWVHRVEVVGNHVGQLLVPWALFAPQPAAGIAGAFMVALQLWLILSGNFAWLNALTLTLAFAAFDDQQWGWALPFQHGSLAAMPLWFEGVTLAFAAAVVVLSWWPVRNMLSRNQLMNASFNPIHVVNTYGLFGQITRERFEVVLEGTADRVLTPSTTWQEYEFWGKPGDPRRRPPQVAPYHLRLDWLMWFAALGPPQAHAWIFRLAEKLLQNDPPTLKLLRRNPFAEGGPAFVRASFYRYRFTTWRERKERGDWWTRERLGAYLPPLQLEPERQVEEVRKRGLEVRPSGLYVVRF
jgi:hypothetical protein